jgi:hypothetical protein
MTTSWDCFDTLVARRKMVPFSVFDALAKKHGLSDFTARRRAAEARAPSSLKTIYDELAKDYQWTEEQKEACQQAEIDEEVEHCCPINETIRLVKDGDLIVSDMYLPPEAISAILSKNGLTQQVTIYVSTGGKSTGCIWPSLPPIKQHIGDNYHSDVESPRAHGIDALHFTGSQMTKLEEEVGGDLALLMRVVRLANPYEPGSVLHSMWLEQSQLNIPALVLAALELPPTGLAFMMRDCVHLQPIHEALWKEQNATLHASRLAMLNNNEAFEQYLREAALGKLVVDLHGSGQSIMRYWKEVFDDEPNVVYLSGHLEKGRVLAPGSHDALERFNSSPLGSVSVYPARKKCEFDERVVQCQADARNCAISHFDHFLFSANLPLFQKLVYQMQASITARANVHIADHTLTLD